MSEQKVREYLRDLGRKVFESPTYKREMDKLNKAWEESVIFGTGCYHSDEETYGNGE